MPLKILQGWTVDPFRRLASSDAKELLLANGDSTGLEIAK
jgi:hypothetical protein